MPEMQRCRSAAERALDSPSWPFEVAEPQARHTAPSRRPKAWPGNHCTTAASSSSETSVLHAASTQSSTDTGNARVGGTPTVCKSRTLAVEPDQAGVAQDASRPVEEDSSQPPEHKATLELRQQQERREREFYKASFGEPCGPENRLLVADELGRGAFSTVFRCQDIKRGKEYAVKFIRANPVLRKATEMEVKLMRRLRVQASEKDPAGAHCLLNLAGPEAFEHEGHLALVFQLQRCSVHYWLQTCTRGHGLSLSTVRAYGRDLLLALRALRRVGVVHNDVKPDNLLMSLDKSAVKLCDFGCAFDASEQKRAMYVRPAYCSPYRAPEAILGQGSGPAVDVWGAGVTLFELATSRRLFPEKTNNGMLHAMLRVCGAFPRRLATVGKAAPKHFTKCGDFKLHTEEQVASERTMPMARFAERSLPLPPHLCADDNTGNATSAHVGRELLECLILGCLTPDPSRRLTPDRALGHSFFHSRVQDCDSIAKRREIGTQPKHEPAVAS